MYFFEFEIQEYERTDMDIAFDDHFVKGKANPLFPRERFRRFFDQLRPRVQDLKALGPGRSGALK